MPFFANSCRVIISFIILHFSQNQRFSNLTVHKNKKTPQNRNSTSQYFSNLIGNFVVVAMLKPQKTKNPPTKKSRGFSIFYLSNFCNFNLGVILSMSFISQISCLVFVFYNSYFIIFTMANDFAFNFFT